MNNQESQNLVKESPSFIKDPNLDYYHKKHIGFNSSITIYGEQHLLDYHDFLTNYVDALYSNDRRQIIILEKNELDLINENTMFKMFMQDHPEKNISKLRKKLAIKIAHSPILYFSGVYKHGGIFPDCDIICGDIRLRKIWDLINELAKANPVCIVEYDFFNRFKTAWEEQLSVLNSPEYLVIKDEINILLSGLIVTMTYSEFEQISNKLNEKWVNISNISMVQHINKHIKDGVDIVLFVGALHMDHLIQEISNLFPLMSVDMDTDSQYMDYWFWGHTRLEAEQIESDKLYDIRFKNGSGARLGTYTCIGFNGAKIILEDSDGKICDFDSNNVYAYAAQYRVN